jgi:hypothetical protein
MSRTHNADPQDSFNAFIGQLLAQDAAAPKHEPEHAQPEPQRGADLPGGPDIDRRAEAQKKQWGIEDKPEETAAPDAANLGRPVVTRQYETVASAVLSGPASVAERSYEWTKGQVHNGLQDFVSRILLGESVREPAKEHERDHDNGMDR